MTSDKRKKSASAPSRRLTAKQGLLILIVVIIAAGVALASPYAFTGAPSQAQIRIPAKASWEQYSDTLAKYMGDDFAARTLAATKLFMHASDGIAERSGMYTIEQGMSPMKAARMISRGEQTDVKLTINGFRSLSLMSERIARKMGFSPEEMLRAATDPKVLARYDLKPEQAMALFLDDTYFMHWGDSPEHVVEKIGDNYLNVWNKDRREKAAKLGISPVEAVIIASIADEESNKADEKDKITRLYLNRLHKGMKLQADPTVKFAIGDFSIRRITTAMTTTDSPYNTYRYAGLPPGPIRTTSTATIDALLNSKLHDYLYMCAKEDFSGYHNFAADYATHQENARRYQQKLNELNIK